MRTVERGYWKYVNELHSIMKTELFGVNVLAKFPTKLNTIKYFKIM